MEKWLLAPSRPLDLRPVMYTHTHTYMHACTHNTLNINGIFLLLLSFFEWMFTRVNSDDISDDTRTIYILGLHKVRKIHILKWISINIIQCTGSYALYVLFIYFLSPGFTIGWREISVWSFITCKFIVNIFEITLICVCLGFLQRVWDQLINMVWLCYESL